MEGIPYTITNDYDHVDWEKVFKILMAYSHMLLSKQKVRKAELAQLSYDFAINTITSYLEQKEKFDPSRNPDLVKYLKYSICRRLVSNYGKSSAVVKDSGKQIEELMEFRQFVEEMPIDENIDVSKIVNAIKGEINHDEIMSIIFDALYEEGMKRAEICEEFEIDVQVYDNAIKRIRRIAAKHLD